MGSTRPCSLLHQPLWESPPKLNDSGNNLHPVKGKMAMLQTRAGGQDVPQQASREAPLPSCPQGVNPGAAPTHAWAVGRGFCSPKMTPGCWLHHQKIPVGSPRTRLPRQEGTLTPRSQTRDAADPPIQSSQQGPPFGQQHVTLGNATAWRAPSVGKAIHSSGHTSAPQNHRVKMPQKPGFCSRSP